jgi:hypothetical protein
MANQGLIMPNFYTGAPLCSPCEPRNRLKLSEVD